LCLVSRYCRSRHIHSFPTRRSSDLHQSQGVYRMRNNLLLPVALLLSLSFTVKAQEAGADKEKNTIRQVVETYLYAEEGEERKRTDQKSTRLNSSHLGISYAVFCVKK